MKFITEEDLRDLYRKEPFTSYEIEPGARFTPGARQYLMDRGINMLNNDSYPKTSNINEKPQALQIKNWKKKKLSSSMRSVEALFLLTEEELLGGDVSLAQKVIDLGQQFHRINDMAMGKGLAENLSCQDCTGIKNDNFSDDLGDCFEITELHMELKNGRKIIILHRLRCALREIEPVVLELYEDNDENELCKEIIKKVNQIINILSQMICSVFGGEKCQRKI